MHLAPILHSYFQKVVRPRERENLLPYVDSMLAVLEVVMLLQSSKTCTVTPPELSAAIEKHLKLHWASWGELHCRPKHHYALHLADMLERFGYLLASFVHERKHRLVNKYGRDRRNAKAFDCGLIEDITCHQLWELQQAFYFATHESKPTGIMRRLVQDLLPDVAPDAISMLSHIAVNGGRASPGDIVAFFQDGELQVGEMLLAVGMQSTTPVSTAFIAKWQQLDLEGMWLMCRMSDSNVCQIDIKCLDSVLPYKPASDSTCAVFVPPELRPQ